VLTKQPSSKILLCLQDKRVVRSGSAIYLFSFFTPDAQKDALVPVSQRHKDTNLAQASDSTTNKISFHGLQCRLVLVSYEDHKLICFRNKITTQSWAKRRENLKRENKVVDWLFLTEWAKMVTVSGSRSSAPLIGSEQSIRSEKGHCIQGQKLELTRIASNSSQIRCKM